jgi:nucleotide-binding universal stress UspA family protein
MEEMSRFRNILVPLDGTEHSEQALPFAVECARRSDAKLIVLSVAPDLDDDQSAIEPSSDTDERPSSDLGVVLSEYLQGIHESLVDQVGNYQVLLTGGDPTTQILETVERNEVDLIVMATHGRTGIARGFLGSVTDATTSGANVPVVAIGNDMTAEDGQTKIEVVHVALDGSELADTAIPVAMSMAKAFGARLNLVRVVETERRGVEVTLAQIHLDDHRLLLSKDNDDIEVQASLLRGSPAEELMAMGRSTSHAVMAITTRGNRGLTRIVRGSVADHLIRESTIPILIQSPQETNRLGTSIH